MSELQDSNFDVLDEALKKYIKKIVRQEVNRRETDYVKGDKGIANYLGLDDVTPIVVQIRKHLTPFHLTQKTRLYKKTEINEIIQKFKVDH